jgi:hypothetical protein
LEGWRLTEQPKKPFCFTYDEAEDRIFYAVSKSAEEVPFFMLEGILTNILHQVREKANAERENARMLYEKQIAEYNEKEEKEENVCREQ